MATKKKFTATLTGGTAQSGSSNSRVNLNTGLSNAKKTASNIGGKIAVDYATNGPILSGETIGTGLGAAAGLGVTGAGAAIGAGVGAAGMLVNGIEYLKYAKQLRDLEKNKPGNFQRNDGNWEQYNNAWNNPTEWDPTGLRNHPGEYSRPYDEKMQTLLEKIEGRPDFNYDFTQDPTYWNYRDQYVREGKLAMQDTVADASALTGGYGNSYAMAAGSQAYQSYLNDLNDIIPTLRSQAFEEYKAKGNDMYKQMDLLQSLDQGEYEKWQGKLNEYYTALGELWNRAQYLDEQDWQEYLQIMSQWNLDRDYATNRIQQAKSGFMEGGQLAANSIMNFGNQVTDVGMQVGAMAGKDIGNYLGNRATNYALSLQAGAGTQTAPAATASASSGTTKKKSTSTKSTKSTKSTSTKSNKTDTAQDDSYMTLHNNADTGEDYAVWMPAGTTPNPGSVSGNDKLMNATQFESSKYAKDMTYQEYLQYMDEYYKNK